MSYLRPELQLTSRLEHTCTALSRSQRRMSVLHNPRVYGLSHACVGFDTLSHQVLDHNIGLSNRPRSAVLHKNLSQTHSLTCPAFAPADAPYELSPEFLHELFTKHRIDYVVHGDDPCLLPDGTDAYAYAKKLHRFKMIKRTEGVSSTDIVGRMLMCTRDNARFREVRDLAFTENE